MGRIKANQQKIVKHRRAGDSEEVLLSLGLADKRKKRLPDPGEISLL